MSPIVASLTPSSIAAMAWVPDRIQSELLIIGKALGYGRNDKREYRRIVLQNSLQCVAFMNVGIGSFSDPDDLEGFTFAR
ncbi:hypothetical protein ACSBR1_034267 [Camellia fascicularis]